MRICQKLLPYYSLGKYCVVYYFLLVDKDYINPLLEQRKLH